MEFNSRVRRQTRTDRIAACLQCLVDIGKRRVDIADTLVEAEADGIGAFFQRPLHGGHGRGDFFAAAGKGGADGRAVRLQRIFCVGEGARYGVDLPADQSFGLGHLVDDSVACLGEGLGNGCGLACKPALGLGDTVDDRF